ncbi:Uncharacterised protein [Streptococcus pneumoniae]|nr:Uncharacterised protein [Streptococcus pneumoniae]
MRATISFVYSAPLTAASAPFSKAVFTSTSFEALSNQESTHGASASTSVLSPTTAPLPNDLSPIDCMPCSAACNISANSFTVNSRFSPAALLAARNAPPQIGPDAPPQCSIIIMEQPSRNDPIVTFSCSTIECHSRFNCLNPFATLIPKSPSPACVSSSQNGTSFLIIISLILSTR